MENQHSGDARLGIRQSENVNPREEQWQTEFAGEFWLRLPDFFLFRSGPSFEPARRLVANSEGWREQLGEITLSSGAWTGTPTFSREGPFDGGAFRTFILAIISPKLVTEAFEPVETIIGPSGRVRTVKAVPLITPETVLASFGERTAEILQEATQVEFEFDDQMLIKWTGFFDGSAYRRAEIKILEVLDHLPHEFHGLAT